MRFKRWHKVFFLVIIWIALVIVMNYPLSNFFPNLAWIGIIATVVTLLVPRILDKILDIIFGKEEQREGSITQEQLERIAKLGAIEKYKLEEKAMRREELKNSLRTHYHQLVEEVYEKWFDRPPLSIDTGVRTEYSISLANIIYAEEEITIRELEEPSHQNKRIIEDAIEHLKCYHEIWYLWKNAKKQVKQTLNVVEKLWRDLIQSLTEKLSTSCPQIVKWDVSGAYPDDYYSLRITFHNLWSYIQNNRNLNELRVTKHDDHFLVKDFAKSLNKTTMEAFVKVIKELATDSVVQKKMNKITDKKTCIEVNMDKFRASLELIADDVQRKDKKLEGNCPTCKPWLDELATLGT